MNRKTNGSSAPGVTVSSYGDHDIFVDVATRLGYDRAQRIVTT